MSEPNYANIYQNYIDRFDGMDLTEMTGKLLYKYGWEMRNESLSLQLDEEHIAYIDKIVEDSFIDDFYWVGHIPYIALMNLKGLYDNLMRSDEDSVIGLVAPPGRGKTTASLCFARFLDPTFEANRIIFTIDELKKFLRAATNIFNKYKQGKYGKGVNPLAGKVVILDEGVYILFSGDAASKDGKLAQKLFSVIRALNLIFIVNITNWRKISQGVKEDRFAGLFRIQTKGILEFYSRKRIAKIKINKDYITFGKCNFYDKIGYIGPCKFWEGYELKKSEFLITAANGVAGKEK